MRILIVDDERGFIELLKDSVIDNKHSVDFAYDGRKALLLMKENKYDLIFVDHNMPELTGLELIKFAKENKLTSKMVMITGYEEMEGFFMKQIGADEFLTKPVKIEDFKAIINKYSK